MINVYKTKAAKKHIDPPFNNPHYNTGNAHHIGAGHKLLAGRTGAGKTNALINLLVQQQDTYESVIIVTQIKNEALYALLQEKLDDACSVIGYDELEMCPRERSGEISQKLIVFDDFCHEKNQTKIASYATYGRKHGYVCVFITQSFFKTNILIRNQCSELFMLASSNKADVSRIASTVQFDRPAVLQKMIQNATKFEMHMCIIDLKARDRNKMVRRNFHDYYQLEDADGNDVMPTMYNRPDMKN